MRAKILTITLAACAFALVACKPKVETTKENVSTEAEKVAEGVSHIVEVGVDEVEPATEPTPEKAPVEP